MTGNRGFLVFWRGLMAGGWLPLGEGWEVRHHPGSGTRVRGRIAGAKVAAIREFFGRDLRPSGPVRVRGTPAGLGRATRLKFTGSWTAAQQQRARNFLTELL